MSLCDTLVSGRLKPIAKLMSNLIKCNHVNNMNTKLLKRRYTSLCQKKILLWDYHSASAVGENVLHCCTMNCCSFDALR